MGVVQVGDEARLEGGDAPLDLDQSSGGYIVALELAADRSSSAI